MSVKHSWICQVKHYWKWIVFASGNYDTQSVITEKQWKVVTGIDWAKKIKSQKQLEKDPASVSQREEEKTIVDQTETKWNASWPQNKALRELSWTQSKNNKLIVEQESNWKYNHRKYKRMVMLVIFIQIRSWSQVDCKSCKNLLILKVIIKCRSGLHVGNGR